MSPGSIELQAPAAALRLITDAARWCQVELRMDSQVVPLGAEVHRIVVARLSNGLADELSAPEAGRIGGAPVRWVLSLAEKHCTIYASDDGDKRVLHVQDANAKLIAAIVLTPEDRRRWAALLETGELGEAGSG